MTLLHARVYLATAAAAMASAVVVAAEAATESGACALVDNPSRIPLYMPDVGTTKLHEDEMSVVWNLTIPAGTRLPPHEHMYDYSFHVLEGSTLAVYSGQDGKHIFSFDAPTGHTMSFKREGEMMVDITGAIPPFPAVHGVKNVGEGNYREMLFETKPCKSVPHGEYARRYDNEDMRRIFLAKDGAAAKTHHDGAKILANSENVNDETEKKFTKGYTHGMLLSLDASARDRTPDIPVDALVLDFYPQLVKDAGAEEGMKRVKHMVLVRFKPETPVGEMVAGYIGLTTKISEMKGFEWGPIANKLGEEEKAMGFQYGFVTTFNSEADRTAYLVHEAHGEYVNELVPNLEDFMVFDVLEAQ